MSSIINQILLDIENKKKELKQAYEEMRKNYDFSLKGKKIRFSRKAILRNRKFKRHWTKMVFSPNLRHILSIPFIYIVAVPVFILDIFLFLYQHTAFRLYKIPLVKRKDYIVFDRKELSYLNFIEKFNCMYCSYANGIFAYAMEIGGRTEKYRCPIKHAKRGNIQGHGREKHFADYGDPKGFRDFYNQTTCFKK